MSDLNKREGDALIQLLIDEVKELRTELRSHMTQEASEIKELKEAFGTAKSVIWFIKVAAGIVAGLAVAWAFILNHFTIGIK